MPLNAEDNADTLNASLNDEHRQFENPSYQLRDRAEIRRSDRYETNFVEYLEHTTYEEAVNGADGEAWKKTISEELTFLEDNGTWEIVPLPPSQHAVDLSAPQRSNVIHQVI